ncbi:UDP-N-acetylmuramoyl-tripeptide--D-alanyl-D-alanine ligase [Oleidesulfovibrio sp.]|uniref:UDP-N-acetylmuramoyl-tripeptide--D-alanyl-D- alanine ligase n=1 Tax=Oleidesulfovibrio sp. TaxID=2909707 RepID=UPI003A83D6FC
MNLGQIRDALGAVGSIGEAASQVPTGVQTDSRCIRGGELFFCISGERFDGHTFAADVLKKGACAVVAERPPFSMDEMDAMGEAPVLIVPDTVAALGRLALHHRVAAKAMVAGITGTAGKTTVKELLAHVLSMRGTTAKNHLNKNNQIGLPLSMLDASGDEKFWVMEAGISEAHDMDELGATLRPDLAIVLNVGQGHVSGLGDKGVGYYKARLLSHIARGGVGLVSADYPELVQHARANCTELRLFSAIDPAVPYFAEYAGPAGEGMGRYRVNLEGKEFEVEAPFRGSYGAENVIAVAAAADILGLSSREIIEGLKTAVLPQQRFNCRRIGAWLVVDDTYNSNPLSAGRMVESTAENAAGGPLVLVMGEMLELGDVANEAHVGLGRKMGSANPVAVFWKGGQVDAVQQGLTESGWKGTFASVNDADAFIRAFAGLDIASGTVLFKGSRSNKMEILADAFCSVVQDGQEGR